VLAQKILGISEPSLLFDTMLHLGTLIAVFVVLWKDIWALLKRPFQRLTGLLIAATVPTVIFALLFKDAIEEAFSSGSTLGWEFLATAVILLVAERLSAGVEKGRDETAMSWFDAIVIGALQGIAIMPAVSRSGLTIAGALARKLDRGFAARFSFLLSIPAILGAAVFQGKDLIETAGASGGLSMPVVVGTLVAAAIGFIAVKFMMRIIREGSMRGFAIYVAVVGVLVLLDQNLFHVFF
jgi:undecaprenyl-diphosphatase